MAAKTSPELNDHLEEAKKPRFGPGSDDATPMGNPTDPRGDVASGDNSDPRAERSFNNDELAGKEGLSKGKNSNEAEKSEKGRLFSGDEAPSRFDSLKAKVLANGKRKLAIGASVAVLGGGAFGIFSIASGPFQAIHLSQILSKNFITQERDSEVRIKGLFRYYRTGDIGETRLSSRGSKVFHKTVEELKKIGIEFPERNPITGAPRGDMVIDTSAENSPFKNMGAVEKREAMLKAFEIDDPSILRKTGRNEYRIKQDATTTKGVSLINKNVETSIKLLGDGKLTTSYAIRSAKRMFGLPQLFSPLQKITVARENSLAERAITRDEKRAAEKERTGKLRSPIVQRASAARATLKSNLEGKTGLLSAASLGSAALCIVRESAESAVAVNDAEIVKPSAVESLDKVAVGSQAQAGLNLDARTLGNVVETYDGIWRARALDATANGDAGSGEEIPTEYSQAFSGDTKASKVQDAVQIDVAGLDISGPLCSTPGLIVQGVVDIGLLILAAPTGGATFAVFSAKQGAQIAATAGVFYLLQKQFAKLLADQPILPDNFTDALGGNLYAYGARAASNISYQSVGGVALPNSNTSDFDKVANEREKEEFMSKSFFARTFDLGNYQSVASRTLKPQSFYGPKTIGSILSSSFNVPFLFKSASAGTPDEEPYDWGFPRYGIPQEILNSPDFEDPYENADRVAALLNGTAPSAPSPEGGQVLGVADEYIDRAMKCFGVNITNESGAWDAIAEKDVDPNSAEYEGANCDDTSNKEWASIMMFIFDSRLMATITCYESDDEDAKQACVDSGVEGAPSAIGEESGAANVEPPESINGMQLTPEERQNLKYIKENVLSLLAGSKPEQAELAAESAWWALRESVLKLDQPYIFGYSNCQVPVAGTSDAVSARSPGDGNNHIDVTQVCPNAARVGGNAWQVGIGGVQVPEFSLARASQVAEARNSGKSLQKILEELAVLAGHSAGSPTYNQIVNSTGELRRSLLLRNPATGITLVNERLTGCFQASGAPSWCSNGRPEISSTLQARQDAVEAIKTYFLATGEGAATGTGQYGSLSRDELVQRIKSDPNWSPQSGDPNTDLDNGNAKRELLEVILGILEQVNVKIRPSVIKTGHTACSASGNTSNHYSGLAIDLGDAGTTRADMEKVYKWLHDNASTLKVNELIWEPVPSGTTTLKNGQPLTYNSETRNGHRDHIHLSVQGARITSSECDDG